MIRSLSAFALALLLLSRAAGAATLPPTEAKLSDGLTLTDFIWTDLAVHPVRTESATGEVRFQALLPADAPPPKTPMVPIAGGIEIRFVFALAPANADRMVTRLRYEMTTPRSGRGWLREFGESALLRNLRQSVRGETHTLEADVEIGTTWWISLPVTSKMRGGTHQYSLSFNGAEVASGSFEAVELGRREREEMQRKASIFFFARVAFPHFSDWVHRHEGRMPSSREFLQEIKKLRYMPDIEYTAHRGMPRTYDSIPDPSTTWLAKELDKASDDRIVVCYADGTIGLEVYKSRFREE